MGRARRGLRRAEGRHPPPRGRAGARSRDLGRAARSAAGDHLLARRWRTVRDVPAGVHAASRQARPQPRHVSHAGLRPALHRHALADWQGRRLSLRARRGAQRVAAADGISGRPAGADPVGDRAAAGERARVDARVVDRGRAAAAGCRAEWPSPSVDCERGVRVDGGGRPEDPPARRAVRRSLRLLLAAARLPGVQRQADRASPGRDLSRHRGRQAAAGRFLHRRPAAGAAVAAVPAGDAGGGAAVVVRRNRAITRWPPRWSSNATSAKRWRARSASSAKASCR